MTSSSCQRRGEKINNSKNIIERSFHLQQDCIAVRTKLSLTKEQVCLTTSHV
jgi:hypothetical protein